MPIIIKILISLFYIDSLPPPHTHTELHQTQPVPAQPLCAHTERGNRKKLLVDAESRGREEWKVTPTQSCLHGQHQ